MLPVTFSPPGTAYVPSAEDALRDGILLMFKADTVTWKDMAYDPDNPAKGVRIFAGPEAATIGEGDQRRIVVPQLMVTSVFDTRWTYEMNNGGEKRITIIISLIEARDPAHYDTDVAAFRVTADAKFARYERVLMCGTIVAADQEDFTPRVVDPYRSPLIEAGPLAGTYDPDAIKYLNELGPEISRRVSLVGEDAVAYNLVAAYTVNVANREVMTEAGFS